MPSPEELGEQQFIYFQKIRELQTYLMETRKVHGDISEINYRHNSGIYDGYEHIQTKEGLEKELKEKNAELRRNHRLSPGQVESRIRQYEHEIWKIGRQLDEMRRDHNVESPLQRRYREDIQDAGQEQAPPEIEAAKSKLEEQYEREPEQAYKRGREKQHGANRSEMANVQPQEKSNPDSLRKLYEDGEAQHPAREGEGAENCDFEIPDAGQRPGKGYTP